MPNRCKSQYIEAPVYREDAPPPGVEVHNGQSTDGQFIVKVVTVEGEMDAEFLAALIAYNARVDIRRRGRFRLTLVAP